MTLFEKIAAREIPARIVHETDELLAFHDVHPQPPVHVLIVPKRVIPSITEFLLVPRTFHGEIYALGVLCAVVSFKLRWGAIAALGKFWSLHVEMRENHQFVQEGPFRFVRHPTYFSMILETAAFGLLCN